MMKVDLVAWDGRTVSQLKALYVSGFDWEEALTLCNESDVARGASWLVKHHVWSAGIDPVQTQQLLDMQRSDGPWEVILHLVQALDKVDVTGLDVSHAGPVLVQTSQHDAPFVRAWSISALARIASKHPKYLSDARSLVTHALLGDEKPSVIARLKKAAALLE